MRRTKKKWLGRMTENDARYIELGLAIGVIYDIFREMKVLDRVMKQLQDKKQGEMILNIINEVLVEEDFEPFTKAELEKCREHFSLQSRYLQRRNIKEFEVRLKEKLIKMHNVVEIQ